LEKRVPVFVRDIPTASIFFDDPLCSADVLNFRSNIVSRDPIQYYNWTFSEGSSFDKQNVSLKILRPGNYNVTFIAGTNFGCYSNPVNQSFVVYPSPIISALPISTKICRGQSVNLSADGGSSYLWTPREGLNATGISNPIATPVKDIQYLVTGTNQYGCSSIDSVKIEVIQPYKLEVDDEYVICTGNSVQLNAKGAPQYKWTPPAYLSKDNIPNPVASPPVSTIYTVKGFDELNCFNAEKNVNVKVGQYPVVDLGPDQLLSTGTLYELKPKVTNGPIDIWKWTPSTDLSCSNCEKPLATIRKNITYQVTATNEYGCSGSDEINIKVFCENTQVFIPNAFTPNSGADIRNSYFYVQSKGVMQVKSMRVFNRWGEMVFEKLNFLPNDPYLGWDGRVRGAVENAAVYAYIIEVICDNGTPFFYKGNVTLLK
jgi:gliding motility-associated-like protein